VPELDDEFDDDTGDGHLAGAGSLLSINIRNGKRPVSVARQRTLSERLVDHWKSVRTQKGGVDASDFTNSDFAGAWGHFFEFEPDRWSRGFRIIRIGHVLDGGEHILETGFAPDQSDIMRRSPEVAAMLIDWLKTLATESFRKRQPIIQRDTLPIQTGGMDYSCTVIPLTNRQAVPVSVIGLIETVEGSQTPKGPNR
jgi:hypothetical protein